MLFNSTGFAFFLPIVFLLHWFLSRGSKRFQNTILIAASYSFYACWDWRFLFLLAFSTGLDYFTGRKIFESRTDKHRKAWLLISVVINLGFLMFFKYFNFFSESLEELLKGFGMKADFVSLNIILPVGISFYTFHGLSYVFDLYNRKITPAKNLLDYSIFVSFFPLLVAGPIERATHLLPQLEKARTFDYSKAVDGMRQILWGLFKKIVIADNCAEYANMIFSNSANHSGSTLFTGALFFAFQIYGDFSGYSDIALGTARLFGIELLRNFSLPYFSRDIAEFWRRWHISLSSWFRDYLYIPLGGSRGGNWMKIRNTLIIFLVSGFWHGAKWTFLAWGALNALYIIPSILRKTHRDHIEIVAVGRLLPQLKDVFRMAFTFFLSTLAWVFFRADSLTHAFNYFAGMFSRSMFSIPALKPKMLTLLILLFIIVEWIGRERQYSLHVVGDLKSPMIRRSIYYFLIACLLLLGNFNSNKFIYFQF